jgi:UDP-2,3-diacylglucosamine pyrophosphatase LpxH
LKYYHEFLDWVDNDRLVLAGDITDGLRANPSASLNTYQYLWQRYDAMNVVYTWGNHDRFVKGFAGSDWINSRVIKESADHFTFSAGGKRIRIEHGHLQDPYCRNPNAGVDSITSAMEYLIANKSDTINPAFKTLYRINRWIYKAVTFRGSQRRLMRLYEAWEAHRKECGVDVLITGHTHLPGRINGGIYNCGRWSAGRREFVVVEENGLIRNYHWTEHGPELLN